MEKEIWKDIKDYDGHYQVSNLGNVKSFKYDKEKVLKPIIDKGGYCIVTLCKNKKSKNFKVHRLLHSKRLLRRLRCRRIAISEAGR